MAWGDLLGGALAGIGSFFGQHSANRTNLKLQRRQQDWEERMANTAYQRQVADMQAAGLNPILAAMKGGGADTPSVAPGHVEDEIGPAVNSALAGMIARQQLRNLRAQEDNIKADTMNKDQNTITGQTTAFSQTENWNLIRSQVSEVEARIENLVKDKELKELDIKQRGTLNDLIIQGQQLSNLADALSIPGLRNTAEFEKQFPNLSKFLSVGSQVIGGVRGTIGAVKDARSLGPFKGRYGSPGEKPDWRKYR